MPRNSCAGQSVVITGAARGIGLATAHVLHAAGARVAIGDLDGELAQKEAAQLGDRAIGLEVDITDASSFARLVDVAENALGPVDVLVNNAGIMPIGPFLEESGDTAQRVFDVNIAGTMNGMKTVLPAMVGRRRGHIVNVASVAGKSPVPGGISYAASKAAVVSMTESARVEFADSGVRFTCVMPSFTNTDLIAGTKGTRLIRNVEPDEVGRAIRSAIEQGTKDVYIPGILAAVLRTQAVVGRTVRDRLNHSLGADRAFLDVDTSARQIYDSRIGAHKDSKEKAE